jgi:hypothetical protein
MEFISDDMTDQGGPPENTWVCSCGRTLSTVDIVPKETLLSSEEWAEALDRVSEAQTYIDMIDACRSSLVYRIQELSRVLDGLSEAGRTLLFEQVWSKLGVRYAMLLWLDWKTGSIIATTESLEQGKKYLDVVAKRSFPRERDDVSFSEITTNWQAP